MIEYDRKQLQAIPSLGFLISKRVEFELNGDETKIEKIKLPCSSDELIDLMNKEGKTLGVCCSAISEMRDIIFEAVREGCWIDTSDLNSFYELAVYHGHFQKELNWNHPVYRIMMVWDKIKDDAEKAPAWRDKIYSIDFKDPSDMLSQISTMSSWLELNSMSSDVKNKDDYRHLALMTDFHLLGSVMQAYLGEMKKLAQEFKFQKETTGFALVYKSGENKGKIAKGRIGAMVFPLEEIAEKVRQGNDELEIKEATLSLESGLKLK